MTGRWRLVPFKDAVADESGGNVKTPQGEYLSDGRFAVVDQGKQLISGYVNDPSRLCLARLPVIVFGDHTRCIKFVDFPFCMGADGTKVLRPKLDTDARYLYHYLRQLRLPDRGYDRHFKYLRRTNVLLPPLAEQRRIAGVLDRAEALRAKRRAAIAQIGTLTRAMFLDLFGDPATNPRGWSRVELRHVVDGKYGVKAGPFGSSLRKEEYTTSGYRVYGQEQVIAGRFDIGDYFIGERKFEQLKACAVNEGDVLISLVGSFGKVLVVPPGVEPGIINPRLLKIRLDSEVLTPDFLAAMLTLPSVQLEFKRMAHGGTMGVLNAGALKHLPVVTPPLVLQREYSVRAAAAVRLTQAHRASLVALDELFNALAHRAFRGEL